MKGIIKAYYISLPNLRRQLLSPVLWFFLVWGVVSTLLISWNEERSLVEFGSLQLKSTLGHDREASLQRVFYDFFALGWLLFVFFMFSRVLLPVNMSYTVSQSLWLRLSHTSTITLTAARLLQVLAAIVLASGASLLWVILYSSFHGIGVSLLQHAVFGIAGYAFLSGGVIVFFSGRPNLQTEKRFALVVLAASLPFLLYLIGKHLGSHFDGFFPYAVPIGAKSANWDNTKASITAVALGCSLMGLHVFIQLLFNLSLKTSSK
jgi:hypothetical protein